MFAPNICNRGEKFKTTTFLTLHQIIYGTYTNYIYTHTLSTNDHEIFKT